MKLYKWTGLSEPGLVSFFAHILFRKQKIYPFSQNFVDNEQMLQVNESHSIKSACWVFFHDFLSSFFGPDLGPNCLQRSSADDKIPSWQVKS